MAPRQKPKRKTAELARLLGRKPPGIEISPPSSSVKRSGRNSLSKKTPVTSTSRSGVTVNSSGTMRRKADTPMLPLSPPKSSTNKYTHTSESSTSPYDLPNNDITALTTGAQFPPLNLGEIVTDSPLKRGIQTSATETLETPIKKFQSRIRLNPEVRNFFSPRISERSSAQDSAPQNSDEKLKPSTTQSSALAYDIRAIPGETYRGKRQTNLRSPMIRTYGRRQPDKSASPKKVAGTKGRLADTEGDHIYSVPSSPAKPMTTTESKPGLKSATKRLDEDKQSRIVTRPPLALKDFNVRSSVRTSKFAPLRANLGEEPSALSKPNISRLIQETKRKSDEEKRQFDDASASHQDAANILQNGAPSVPRERQAKRAALANPVIISSDEDSSDKDEVDYDEENEDEEFFPSKKARQSRVKHKDTKTEIEIRKHKPEYPKQPTDQSFEKAAINSGVLHKIPNKISIEDDRQVILSSILRPSPRKQLVLPLSVPLVVGNPVSTSSSPAAPDKLRTVIPPPPPPPIPQPRIPLTETKTSDQAIISAMSLTRDDSLGSISDFSLHPFKAPVISSSTMDFSLSSSPVINTAKTIKEAVSQKSPEIHQKQTQNTSKASPSPQKKQPKQYGDDPMNLLSQLLGGNFGFSGKVSTDTRASKKTKISHNNTDSIGGLSGMLMASFQGNQSKKARQQAKKSIREAESSFKKHNDEILAKLQEESLKIVTKEQKVKNTISKRLQELPIVTAPSKIGLHLAHAEWEQLLKEEHELIQLYAAISKSVEDHNLTMPSQRWEQDWNEVEELLSLGETVAEKIIQVHLSAETKPGTAYKNLMGTLDPKETEVAQILFPDSLDRLQKKAWGQVVWGLWEALNNIAAITEGDSQ